MKLSIVATLYRSSQTIDEFVRRAFAAAEPLFETIEMILVNDGSPDDSLEKALRLRERDARIVIVDLSRNFGHHKAIMTGLAHATGDFVYLIDSDLEEEPEYLSRFYSRMREEGCDVVYGVQEARKGGAFERISGKLFFRLANAISDQHLPPNSITARLMKRDYVQALLQYQHRQFALGHLFVMTGFRQIPMAVKKLSSSPTTYSVYRRFDMAVQYITTNSTRLLYLILCVGIGVCSVSMLAILYLIVRYLLNRSPVTGWTSVIVSVWFFGGLVTLILGILGIYIASILTESRRGPYTIVRRIYGRGEEKHMIHEGVSVGR